MNPLVAVERVLRDGQVVAAKDEVTLREGDVVALFGTVPNASSRSVRRSAPRSTPPRSWSGSGETVDLVVESPASRRYASSASWRHDIGHGLYLNAMFRAGESMPYGRRATGAAEGGRPSGRRRGKDRIDEHGERRSGRVIRPSLEHGHGDARPRAVAGRAARLADGAARSAKIALSASVGLLARRHSVELAAHPEARLRRPVPGAGAAAPRGCRAERVRRDPRAERGRRRHPRREERRRPADRDRLRDRRPRPAAARLGDRALRPQDEQRPAARRRRRRAAATAAGMRASQETTRSTVPAISYPVAFAVSNVLFTLYTYAAALIG